jgi:hypothetical protein
MTPNNRLLIIGVAAALGLIALIAASWRETVAPTAPPATTPTTAPSDAPKTK